MDVAYAPQYYVLHQAFHHRPIVQNIWVTDYWVAKRIGDESLTAYLMILTQQKSKWNSLYTFTFWNTKVKSEATLLFECMTIDRVCDSDLVRKLEEDLFWYREAGITRFVLYPDLIHTPSLRNLCHILFGLPAAISDEVEVYRLVDPSKLEDRMNEAGIFLRSGKK